ncbi:hypothetical protein WJX72_001628 [[Myrmecia] bisecta]|uniref:ATP-dependent DNA helicase n=1 Tax=[Myrmecia] bisecta TaxID=41462 RepID=A0AAW1QPY1_9CHLO
MHTVLRDKFGFTSFQGRQEEAIGAALAGRDTFVLMPTGGGKSLCYCLPALVKKGVVVVISPLIALMENQVENLRKKDICCDFLSSTRSAEDRRAILDNIQSQSPQMRLLYATPELLTTDGFMLVLKNMYKRGNLTLFAVDESHCISSWGHDFRPAYRKLSVVRRELPQVPIMALTATAAEKVQDDIVKQLRLRNPALLVSSFNRPNIHYCVHYLFEAGALDPLPHVVALLKEGRSQDAASRWPCAVIYTLKRETAGEVAFSLSAKGIPAAAYHAGLKTAERTCVLSDWASGKTPVVAATVAFGMGIDKADVRLVVHYNLPKTIEGFYQESGRAGRDGRPAKSVLFYSRDDRDRMDFILGKPKKGKRKRKQPKSQQGNGELQAFGQLVGYCTARCCRRAILLRHFGEVLPAGTCTGCDYCEDPHGVAEQLERLESEVVIGAARRGGRRRSFGKADLPAYAGGADLASSAEDGKDSSDAASGEDEDDSEEAQAAKQALKRARTGDASDEAVLSVMAAAERRYANTSQQTGCTSNSLLNKLRLPNTKAAPAKPGSAVVGESMRAAARERIQKALEANGALSNLSQQQLAAASQACEEQCFNTSGSKPVYLSKLSNTAREAAKVAAVMDITCLAGCADPTDLGTTDATQDASLPEEVHADKAAAGPSQGAAGRMGSTPSRMMGKPIPTVALANP